MDSQFLKFWGNFLLQTAEGTRQMEDWVRWMNAGNPATGDLARMLRSFYGLSAKDPLSPENWDKATARFQTAWSDFLRLFDVVPRDRFETERRQKDALEKQVKAQNQTIQKLRRELVESRMAEGKLVEGFQQLMALQNDQFKAVSDNIGKLFSPSSSKDKPSD